MGTFALDPKTVRDIAPAMLDARGRVRVVPASMLASTTPDERMLFGVRHGVYGFPTEELCDYLIARIAGRRAIEIGAGNGVLAEALGIPATDNRQQEEPELKAYYQRLGQPTVSYGDNVEKLDAAAAIAKYKPEVVIACWVTHRFDPSAPERGGSNTGVDEAEVVAACNEYIFIGNQQVHAAKPIWALAHERIAPEWLYSRAMNGTPEFIAVWSKAVR
ncbi:hypothetical protein GCM10007320_63320 [Pseudorhodoferax aquiterrae]|uniref:Class I SAM-dependent methyltransferase n=2 Tax=Pseudorhodoferax aquiterrae TaxID=747304 RepID=A0ABQ3GG46_9BURK|nr:hypothetical protein GCM10007320_63320 [Pseudorhodoferax aquiterrae]